MVFPTKPSPDGHEFPASYQIAPHFYRRPGLTRGDEADCPLPYLLELNPPIRSQIDEVYRKYGLTICPYRGLFIAGSAGWAAMQDRPFCVLLVIELRAEEIHRWVEIDNEVRAILQAAEEGDDLLDILRPCIRYYKYRADGDPLYPGEEDDNYAPHLDRPTRQAAPRAE